MSLYEALKTKTGGRKAATVQDIIKADLGFADAESIYAAVAKDSRLQHDPDGGRVRINPDATKPVAEKLTPADHKPTTKRGGVQTTGFRQNEHMWALLNDRELTATQFAVATRIHYYAYAPASGGKCQKARATLAVHCGISEETLKRVAKVLVERGYFIRVDTGQGGAPGQGKSTYAPTLPEWMT